MIKTAKRLTRVVISGLGVISSIGIGKESFWRNVILGKSGITPINSSSAKGFACSLGGEVRGFISADYLQKHQMRFMGRASQFAIVASRLALKDAGIGLAEFHSSRACICVGTTMGEAQVLEELSRENFELGVRAVNPQNTPLYPSQSISFHLAKEFKVRRTNFLFANACASGNYAIGYAYDLICSGRAAMVLAGGVDAMTRLNVIGFSRLLAVAPEKCQPFDKNRKGMMVGEGCGILILESLESAVKRKANIYAEILGYGLSCDAKHMTNPSDLGIARAMNNALINSGVLPDQIEYISAHGTGTKENDRSECAAIYKVFCFPFSKWKDLSKIPE